MISALSIQVSFLLCESIICFMCGCALLIMKSSSEIKRRPMVVLTFLSALLLLADFFAFILRGTPGTAHFIGVKVSNGIVFLVSDLIVYTYSLYLYACLWGKIGIVDKAPAVKRLFFIHITELVGVILVIVSQFNNMYYYFDENNYYHRGTMYPLSLLIPALGLVASGSILIQYHKRITRSAFLLLLCFEILPVVAVSLQSFIYGISLINITIGFSVIAMFGEFILWQSREIGRAEKTEIRTGLSNEHGCIEQLKNIREVSDVTRFAVVAFNISRFSLINRKYGIDAGTQVIINYAKQLEKYLDSKEFLGRQGSDQFIAVIKKEHIPEFLKLLENQRIRFTFDSNEIDVQLSAVSGVYRIEDTKTGAEECISNAVGALGYAKNVLRTNTFEQTESTIKQINEKKQFEEMLPEAMRKEEFLVYYQPKVNSKTRTLVGAEALVRWMHEGQLVSPGKFIPIMEANDLICNMDYYMLSHVCADLEKWIEAGLVPPTVSVNFSRRNLTNENIATDIDKIVKSYHIPKKLIEIEITETVDEFPLSVLKKFVDELHRLGYKVAVDDFGCGSSSLSLLREITFDTLKIDKGFVDRAYAKDLTILGYIIKLAKAINLEILAEGVETEEQVGTLYSLGCEVIQGYFFDRPLPHDTMEKRLINRRYYQEK